MSDAGPHSGSLSPQVALCADAEALDRFLPVLRNLVVGLVDQAIAVRLVSTDRRVESLRLGPVQICVHRPIRWPRTQRRTAELLDALAPQPPDVVHAISSSSYRAADEIARAFDAELVYQITSPRDIHEITRRAYHGVNRFVASTEPLASMLSEALPIHSDHVDVIRPGATVADAVGAFSDSDRTPTLLSFAELTRVGGAEALIEAAALVRTRGRDFVLFLLGAGRREWAVRRLIHARELSEVVTLARPEGDITQVLRGGDILVRATATSGFAAEALYAMGMGLAVVTPGHPAADFLRPGETAEICEKPTPPALAEAIDRLLSDPPRARRLAETAMEFVRTHHSVSQMAMRTAELYRGLCAHRATYTL